MNKTMAAKLISWGFKFIPLDGKRPVQKEWQRTGIDDIEVMAKSDKNWGINAGVSGLFILDLDIKNGKDGVKALAALEEKHGKLPKTFTVGTPSGGRHLVFRGEGRTTTGTIAEGIDTRGVGGQVVSPLTEGYQVLDWTSPVEAPPWILKAAKKSPDTPVNIEEMVIDMGSRNDQLSRIAGYLRGIGFPEEQIIQNLMYLNETACEVPLPEREVLQIAHSISRYSSEEAKEQAKLLAKQQQREKDFKEYKEAQGESVPINANTLIGEPPPRVWVIPDWIPRGEVSSLYGSGGTGKSLLALQMAYAIANGLEWMGLPTGKGMPVLYVACEDDIHEMHRRLRDIRISYRRDPNGGDDTDLLLLWSRVGQDTILARHAKGELTEGLFYDLLKDALGAMPEGHRLMVFDTLTDGYMAPENTRELVNWFIKFHIGRLRLEYDLTPVMIAHPSRAGTRSGEINSGSTHWENAVRCKMSFYKDKDDDKLLRLRRDKSNYAKMGEELCMEWQDGVFWLKDDPVEIGLRVVREHTQLLDELVANVDLDNCKSLAELLTLDPFQGYNGDARAFKNTILKVIKAPINYFGDILELRKADRTTDGDKYRSHQWVITRAAANIPSEREDENESLLLQ